VGGRDAQWLLQHAKGARMKLPAATGLGRGVLRRSVETATVEGAAGPVKAERAKGGG
jgi:hypothetical protein